MMQAENKMLDSGSLMRVPLLGRASASFLGSYMTKALVLVLAMVGLFACQPRLALASCVEVFMSTCVGDFADGGDIEENERLLGNTSFYGFGILQGNLPRIYIASGNPAGYAAERSTPSRAGFIGLHMDGVGQLPAFQLDLYGDFRSTGSAYVATAQGKLVVGSTGSASIIDTKAHIFGAAGSTTSLLVVSTSTKRLFEVSGSSINLGVTLVFPDGSTLSAAPGSAALSWTISGNEIYQATSGDVLIGTQAAGAKLKVVQPAGTEKPGMQISTGTTKLFEVASTSVTLGTPLYFSDGSFLGRSNKITCQIYISSFNSLGTTNTKIWRFMEQANSGAGGIGAPSQYLSSGTCMSHSGNAVAGSSITILESGWYEIGYMKDLSSQSQIGISINSTELTTNIQAITVGRRILTSVGGGAAVDWFHGNSGTVRLYAGDVIRLHGQGTVDIGITATLMSYFSITKVSD